MQPIPRRILFAFILLLGLAWTTSSRLGPEAAASGQPAAPQTGFPAPEIILETLDGESISLADLQGQAVIVNFWASWCPPCRAEMPAIQRVYDDYRAGGLVVLAVNTSDNLADAQAFLSANGLTFPVLFDHDGAVGVRYRVSVLPTTFFIDKRGIIRSVVIGGPLSEASLRARIADLLEEAP